VHGTRPECPCFRFMEPPRLDRYKRRSLDKRLRALWAVLKAQFASQAKDDLMRAEERHQGRNDPNPGPVTFRT
jgi:hypothetical protein